MKSRFLYTVITAAILYTNVYAQYNNSFFYADAFESEIDSGHYLFHFDNFNYFRNTEYTSKVDKGSTYIGFNLQPYAQYSFNKNAQLFAGFNLRYDFGNPNIKSIEPYFKFQYKLWGHDISFGSLQGNVQHRLIEPLLDYERAITDRYETGVQIQYPGKVFDYDIWIDWNTMIYENDPFNEAFFGGYNLYVNPINNGKTKLSLNMQAITLHQAGEIDQSVEPNAVEYNFAYGLEFTQQLNEHTELFLGGHAAYYEDASGILASGFRDGLGQQGVLRLTHKEYQFVLNYWDSHQFQAPWGEQLYHSIGNKNPMNPIDYRKMAGFRISYEKEIGHNLVFLNRVGVNYNIDHVKTDVTMENYLRWHFTSKKPKQLHIN